MSEGKFDPHRRLCPTAPASASLATTGAAVCAGGAPAARAPRRRAFTPAAGIEDDDVDEDEDGDEDGGRRTRRARGRPGAGAFDPNRRLCPDGGCIGLIGADGVCNVCGQKAD